MNLKDLEKYFQPIIGEEDLTSTQLLSLSFIFLALFVFYPLESRRRREAQQQRRRREAQQQRQRVYNELTEIGITETDFQNNDSKFIPTIGRLSAEEIQNLINLIKRHYPEKDNIINGLRSLKSRTVHDDMKRNLTPEQRRDRFLKKRRQRNRI